MHNKAVSTSYMTYNGPVNKVTILFSDEVKTKLETIDSFDVIDFNQTVINALDAKDLFSAGSDKTLEILINSVSIEPTTSTVLSDINSETAHIKGNLIIKNKVNQIVGQHNISAEYAKGKLKDRQEEFRPDWLYTQFANQTTQTLTGKVNKKSALANDVTNNNQAVSNITTHLMYEKIAEVCVGCRTGIRNCCPLGRGHQTPRDGFIACF